MAGAFKFLRISGLLQMQFNASASITSGFSQFVITDCTKFFVSSQTESPQPITTAEDFSHHFKTKIGVLLEITPFEVSSSG